jgi:hypothetical protein
VYLVIKKKRNIVSYHKDVILERKTSEFRKQYNKVPNDLAMKLSVTEIQRRNRQNIVKNI